MTPWFNYSAFYEKLKQKFAEHRHIVENSWIISTNCTAVDIISELKPFMNFDKKIELHKIKFFVSNLKMGLIMLGMGLHQHMNI